MHPITWATVLIQDWRLKATGGPQKLCVTCVFRQAQGLPAVRHKQGCQSRSKRHREKRGPSPLSKRWSAETKGPCGGQATQSPGL